MEQLDPTLCACGCGRERPRYIHLHEARSRTDSLWMGILCDLQTGCWLWQRGLAVAGYGLVTRGRLNGGMSTVHREMWKLVNGPIPKDKQLLHTCDVLYPRGDVTYRRCCRPDHLKLGTSAENTRHMVKAGRSRLGTRKKRLSEEQVRAIRARWTEGSITQSELGREYGIGYKQVGLIVSRRCWANLA